MANDWKVVTTIVASMSVLVYHTESTTCDVNMTLCPQHCTCYLSGLLIIDCVKRNMTALPDVLPKCREYKLHLKFSQNRLKTLTFKSYLRETSILDVSFNELHTVGDYLFNTLNFPVLDSLHLDNNQLKTLPGHSKKLFESLHVVAIHNNPWLCDCNIKWITEWISEGQESSTTIEHISNITCNSPPELKTTLLRELPEKVIPCHGKSNSKLLVALGITAACVAYLSITSVFAFCIVLRRREKISDTTSKEFSRTIGDP